MMFCIFIASMTNRVSPALTSWPVSTSTETTRPGIGESTRREVSGGFFARQPLVQVGGRRASAPARAARRGAVADAVALGAPAPPRRRRPRRPARRGTAPEPGLPVDRRQLHRAAFAGERDLERVRASVSRTRRFSAPTITTHSVRGLRWPAAAGRVRCGGPGRDASRRPSRSSASSCAGRGREAVEARPETPRRCRPVESRPSWNRGWSITAERNGALWPSPSMCEVLQRPAMRVDRLGAGRAPGRQLGDHRVVEHRDLVAFAHAGVDAHDARRRARPRPAPGSAPAGRSRAGSRGRDPRRRAGSRSPSR